jgi:hypothetical protein
MSEPDGVERAGVSAGCCLGVLAFNLIGGGWCFDYALWAITGRDVPWYTDLIAGALLGQFVAPIAIVCWVLQLGGLHAPFFPTGGAG